HRARTPAMASSAKDALPRYAAVISVSAHHARPSIRPRMKIYGAIVANHSIMVLMVPGAGSWVDATGAPVRPLLAARTPPVERPSQPAIAVTTVPTLRCRSLWRLNSHSTASCPKSDTPTIVNQPAAYSPSHAIRRATHSRRG